MRIITNSRSRKKGGFLVKEQMAIFSDTDDFCKAYECTGTMIFELMYR